MAQFETPIIAKRLLWSWSQGNTNCVEISTVSNMIPIIMRATTKPSDLVGQRRCHEETIIAGNDLAGRVVQLRSAISRIGPD